MNRWIWQEMYVQFEATAKDIVEYENKTGEEYKRRKYKAYYTKDDDGYIVHYATKFEVMGITYKVVAFRGEHSYTKAYIDAGYETYKGAQERVEKLRKYGGYTQFEIIREAHALMTIQGHTFDKYIEMEVKAV